MPAAKLPADEEERLRVLYDYQILDTMEESSFDAICQLAAMVCETPVSLITLVDRTRQWFKAAVGWDARQTERDCSFCAHAILEKELLVVDDTQKSACFRDNSLVLSSPNVRFYAGKPLRAFNGMPLGTLCVIDRKPRHLSSEQLSALETLATQVEHELELRRLNRELALQDEQRERVSQFIVHDLSNPMAAIRMIADELAEKIGGDPLLGELAQDLGVASERVHRMVRDLRDLVTSREGQLAPRWQRFAIPLLMEELTSLTRAHRKEHQVSLEWVARDVSELQGDPDLVTRVLQNLIFNAIEHSPRGSTVTVTFRRSSDESHRVQVDDEGPGPGTDDPEELFEMYAKHGSARRESRGIGLAFCRCAIHAHGGRIGAEPRLPHGSCFWFDIPDRPGI